MATYRKSPEADQDLRSIWLYMAEADRAAATRFIDRLHGQMGELAEMPGLGRPRENLAPNLRSFPVGRFLIFYRTFDSGIEVARVLSARRDSRMVFEGE